MDYRLKENEKLSRGIRRIAERQAAGITQCLKGDAKQSEAVHAARTHIKKLRALARLIRKPIGRKLYTDCNDILKDIAKSLAPLRDAYVRLRTLERLKQAHPEQLPGQPALQTLLTQAQPANLPVHAQSAKWRKRQVNRLLAMIGSWPLDGIKKRTLKKGIERSSHRVRKKFKEAKKLSTVENLHTWRKAAKDLAHQMAVMEDVVRIKAKQLAIAKKLGQLLGDDHDLAMFQMKAAELRRPLWQPIQKVIGKKRKALQKAAFKLGHKLKSK